MRAPSRDSGYASSVASVGTGGGSASNPNQRNTIHIFSSGGVETKITTCKEHNRKVIRVFPTGVDGSGPRSPTIASSSPNRNPLRLDTRSANANTDAEAQARYYQRSRSLGNEIDSDDNQFRIPPSRGSATHTSAGTSPLGHTSAPTSPLGHVSAPTSPLGTLSRDELWNPHPQGQRYLDLPNSERSFRGHSPDSSSNYSSMPSYSSSPNQSHHGDMSQGRMRSSVTFPVYASHPSHHDDLGLETPPYQYSQGSRGHHESQGSSPSSRGHHHDSNSRGHSQYDNSSSRGHPQYHDTTPRGHPHSSAGQYASVPNQIHHTPSHGQYASATPNQAPKSPGPGLNVPSYDWVLNRIQELRDNSSGHNSSSSTHDNDNSSLYSTHSNPNHHRASLFSSSGSNLSEQGARRHRSLPQPPQRSSSAVLMQRHAHPPPDPLRSSEFDDPSLGYNRNPRYAQPPPRASPTHRGGTPSSARSMPGRYTQRSFDSGFGNGAANGKQRKFHTSQSQSDMHVVTQARHPAAVAAGMGRSNSNSTLEHSSSSNNSALKRHPETNNNDDLMADLENAISMLTEVTDPKTRTSNTVPNHHAQNFNNHNTHGGSMVTAPSTLMHRLPTTNRPMSASTPTSPTQDVDLHIEEEPLNLDGLVKDRAASESIGSVLK